MRIVFPLVLAFVFWSADGVRGDEHWPQWRGPTLDGVSAAKNPPVEWGEKDGKNVLWKVPLPSWSGATPIVWGDRVFVLSASKPEEGKQGDTTRRLPQMMGGRAQPGGKDVLLLCFSAADGKLLWQKTLDGRNQLFGKQNMASPSPVTDGKHVWALTGTGVLTAFDLAGEQKWRVDLQEMYGEFGLVWGYASSPLLHENLVIVQVLRGMGTKEPAYLVAFDGASGKIVWRVERKTDAQHECPDAYTTPTLSKHDGRVDLVVSGADYVTGHDLKTGRELWRAAGLNPRKEGNYRVCASPVAVDGLIIAPTRVKPLIALRAGGEGDVTQSHFAWKLEKGGPDVPTPVSDGKYLYVVNDKGMVTCVELKTGEVKWGPTRTATGTVSASPLLADGKLYVTNESAITTVLATGPEFKVLATNTLEDDYTIASLAAVDGRIFVRTATHLYCIGGK